MWYAVAAELNLVRPLASNPPCHILCVLPPHTPPTSTLFRARAPVDIVGHQEHAAASWVRSPLVAPQARLLKSLSLRPVKNLDIRGVGAGACPVGDASALSDVLKGPTSALS